MNAYPNPGNHTSLNNIIDITAHSTGSSQEEKLTNNFELLINQTDISIAEPVEIQIDELGNNGITMYQFVGDTSDNKMPGLESIINYMNGNVYTTYDSAINQHNYNTTKKNYGQFP